MVYSEALLCSTAVSSLETKQATRVVLLQGCVLTMNGNIFYSNQAGMEGGAISAERSVIHISSNDFLDTYCNTTGNNSPGVWDIILKLKIQGIFDDPLFSLGVAYFSTMRQGITMVGPYNYPMVPSMSLLEELLLYLETTRLRMAMVALYFHMQNMKSKFVAHFCNNIAVFGDGGISGFLFLHNTNFSDNAAMEENGGAVEFQDGVVTIAGTSQFHTNTASGSGGALWLSNVEFTLMSSSGFSENEALESGGAIHLSNAKAILNGSILVFKNNSAQRGGGIYSQGSQLFFAYTKTTFIHKIGSGALHLSNYQTEVVLLEVNFINNTARECGGAVFVEQGKNTHFKNLLALGNS